MDLKKAQELAEDLKSLACIECTKGWLERYKEFTDPIQEIKECGNLGLITPVLQKRLIQEVQDIKNETSN